MSQDPDNPPLAEGATERGTTEPEEPIDEPYAEDTPLTWVFGNHPEPKLVAAFLSEPSNDLNIQTVADLAGVSRPTVYNHLDTLIDYQIIEETRKLGRSQLYQLRTETSHVRLLRRLEGQLLDEWHDAGKEFEHETESTLTDRDEPKEPLRADIEEPYPDDTPFTWLFGTHPEVKIIATLLSEYSTDLSVTEIAEIADTSRNSVYDHLETLQHYNLVRHERTLGQSKLYTIDTSKQSVNLLAELEEQLLEFRVQTNLNTDSW